MSTQRHLVGLPRPGQGQQPTKRPDGRHRRATLKGDMAGGAGAAEAGPWERRLHLGRDGLGRRSDPADSRRGKRCHSPPPRR